MFSFIPFAIWVSGRSQFAPASTSNNNYAYPFARVAADVRRTPPDSGYKEKFLPHYRQTLRPDNNSMSATFPFELLHRFGKIERKSRFTQETIRLPVCQVIDFHTAFRGNQQADIGIDIVITALQYDLYILPCFIYVILCFLQSASAVRNLVALLRTSAPVR